MNENKSSLGEGILRGLKRIVFTSGPEVEKNKSTVELKESAHSAPSPEVNIPVMKPETTEKDKKMKVYQLLEKMNRQGCDFFEVWNASVELGGASAINIRSAFTSLKYADSSLSKIKLIETGNYYINGLKNILDEEIAKRLKEKNDIEKEKDMLGKKLETEINTLEHQITSLQQKLQEKKNEKELIHSTFNPRTLEIETKIEEGKHSVETVLAEMNTVLDIIQKEIN